MKVLATGGRSLMINPRQCFRQYSDHLFQFVFENALGAGSGEAGNQVADQVTVHYGFQCQPVAVVQMADGGCVQAGQELNHGVQPRRRNVHLQRHLVAGGQRGPGEQGDLLDLGFLPRIGQRGAAGDQSGGGVQQVADDAQAVGADGAAGFAASARPSTTLASVAPQENSTVASMPRSAR